MSDTPVVAPIADVGEYEARVRAEFPAFAAAIDPIIEQLCDVAFHAPDGSCSRCGATVRTPFRQGHVDWHRHLTIGLHFSAWLAAQTLGVLHELADVPPFNPDPNLIEYLEQPRDGGLRTNPREG